MVVARLSPQLFATLVLVIGAGCGGDGDLADKADDPASKCPAGQIKEDGTCCPAGTWYEFDTDNCVKVGPASCLASLGEGCMPNWCADKDTSAGRPCQDHEHVKAECAAGWARSIEDGKCVPAGHFPGSGIPQDWSAVDGSLPDVPNDGPWPKLEALDAPKFNRPFATGCPPAFKPVAGSCVPDPVATIQLVTLASRKSVDTAAS